jgi:integrase/recombinase XerD
MRSCRFWRGLGCAAPRSPAFNWAILTGGRAGEVAVTGKGSRVERLPLPAPTGEALAQWLTDGRPRCASRAVFVTVRRPYRQLTPEAVRQVMGRACDRAGLARRGAHRLRHALATEMLRAGASLSEVGQVLRHRSQLSTSVYAKVDQNALRPLARPWPCPEPGVVR